MKEISTLGQTEMANSQMSPWHIAATMAVIQEPAAIIFPELICILILCYRHQILTHSPPLCTLIWLVQAEAQVSQLGAADAASNPGNSVIKRALIKQKTPASHLCLL